MFSDVPAGQPETVTSDASAEEGRVMETPIEPDDISTEARLAIIEQVMPHLLNLDRHRHDLVTGSAVEAQFREFVSKTSAKTGVSVLTVRREIRRRAQKEDDGGRTVDTPPAGDLLSRLTETSSLPDVKLALEELAARTKTATPAERAIERERAVSFVKKVKVVSSAAKVVDAFIGAPVEPKDTGLALEDVQPAAEPQDTGTLLRELVELYTRHVVLPAGAETVLAVWTMHTWVPGVSHYTPRLLVTSPTKRCGKTLVLELLEATCARAILSASLTAAVLFRAIEALQPTLLVDEADTFLGENEELRGVINAGYKSSGTVLRCEGDDHQVTKFRCFAPVAIAAIGNVPATIADRAFTIKMARKGTGEKVERLDRRARAALTAFPPRLSRWAEDHREMLQELTGDAPESLNDRQREISEPLLMIAELAGGTWPATVREAILKLCGASDGESSDRRERLLAAVWALYTSGVDFLTLKEIVSRLLAEDDSEWHEAARGKPLTPVALGRWLAAYGLRSSQPRSAGQQRGYLRADLAPVAAKYLPDPGSPPLYPVSPVSTGSNQALSLGNSPANPTRVTERRHEMENTEKPNEFKADTGDTGKNPSSGAARGNGVLFPSQIWSAEELDASRRALEMEPR
jgi:putative DNA primase/helicase